VVEITTAANDLNLDKYELTDEEWKLLEDYRDILQVFFYQFISNTELMSRRSLMHSKIFLVLKQLQLSAILFLPSQLSCRDGRNLHKTMLAGLQ
jgi:hypothetical protein